MSDHLCDRCGEYLPEGGARYTVHIQIIADFESIVYTDPDTCFLEEESADSVYPSVEDFGDDVFQEVAFLLCENCKQKFLRDPFNRGTSFFRISKNIKYLFH